MTRPAVWLTVLQALFLGRVLGQVEVVLAAPPWLPAAEHWQSGLLPYPLLLPAQILLLMFMSLVTYDAWRRSGLWFPRQARTRRVLRIAAYVYYTAVLLRYALTMALVPELRWLGHAIPIAFHAVLASYVLVLSLPAEAEPRDRRAG